MGVCPMSRTILISLLILATLVLMPSGAHVVDAKDPLPSEVLESQPHPGVVALSGVTPGSAEKIANMNDPLTKGVLRLMSDLGIKYSEKQTADQDAEPPVGVPQKLLNFSEAQPINLSSTSIGDPNGNFTVISANESEGEIPIY